MSPARSEQGRRLLDEALRLLDLAQAARPAGAGDDAGNHRGPECRICPVCRGIAYLREIDPQAVDRLTAAVADLAGAVRDLLGDAPAPAPAPGPAPDPVRPRVSVQQIDVTD